MNASEMILSIGCLSISIELVGSRITCNPPPTGTDQDYLVLAYDLSKIILLLESNGYTHDGKYNLKADFHSYKNEAKDINFIITKKVDFYNKFMAATSLAKKFNLLDKEDRIALFNGVLYGMACRIDPVTNKEIDYMAITRSFF